MIGIFIIARLGSTRLSQKHLIKVNNKTLIEWLVERYSVYFENEIIENKIKIFIVTSTNPENKIFENVFSKNQNVKIFYGSDENIPLRLFQCAEANDISKIISVDGDDIFCSTSASAEIICQLNKGKDIVKTIGLPLGMNVVGFQKNYLSFCLRNKSKKKLETGWGKIFNESDIDLIEADFNHNNINIRATLDYKEDGIFFETIIEHLQEQIFKIEDKKLIEIICENKWFEINNFLNDEYWNNFYQQKKTE